MKKSNTATPAPHTHRIIKSIAAFVLFAVGLILLPTLGSMQSWEKTAAADTEQEKQLAPQAVNRPDILWMRGGHQLSIYKVIYTSDNQKLITLDPQYGDLKNGECQMEFYFGQFPLTPLGT